MNGGDRQDRRLLHRAGGSASAALSTRDEQVNGGVKNRSGTLSRLKITEGRLQCFKIRERSLVRIKVKDILDDSIRGEGRERQERLLAESLKTANGGIVGPDGARGLGGEKTAGGDSMEGRNPRQHVLYVRIGGKSLSQASGEGDSTRGGGRRRRRGNNLLMVDRS